MVRLTFIYEKYGVENPRVFVSTQAMSFLILILILSFYKSQIKRFGEKIKIHKPSV